MLLQQKLHNMELTTTSCCVFKCTGYLQYLCIYNSIYKLEDKLVVFTIYTIYTVHDWTTLLISAKVKNYKTTTWQHQCILMQTSEIFN